MVLNDFHCHLYTYDYGIAMDKICEAASRSFKNKLIFVPPTIGITEENVLPEKARPVSVGMILNNIREKSLWEKGVEFSLSQNRDNFTVIPFIGIHPWDSEETDEEAIRALEETSAQTGAFIGEIGFDKLKGGDKEKQLRVFRSCLGIALKNEKPFTLHCVRSWGILTEELKKAKSWIKAPFIVHAYNSSAEVMQNIIALGGYPSFGLERYGAFSRNAENSLSKIALKYLLLETDFTCYSGTQSPGTDSEYENSINAGLLHGWCNDTDVAKSAVPREENYYGIKYIKRLLDVYNKAASVLKIDLTELSGVIEENGKVFKAYTINRK